MEQTGSTGEPATNKSVTGEHDDDDVKAASILATVKQEEAANPSGVKSRGPDCENGDPRKMCLNLPEASQEGHISGSLEYERPEYERSGKWTSEEEEFARAAIIYFHQGYVDVNEPRVRIYAPQFYRYRAHCSPSRTTLGRHDSSDVPV